LFALRRTDQARKVCMRRYFVVGCAFVALVATPDAAPKEFATLVVVGADGRSTASSPGPASLERLFDGPTTKEVRGGYVRVYRLGPTGHVGLPGRFYPATGALCVSWNQAAAPRTCHTPPADLLGLLRSQNLTLFRGVGATLATLTSPRVRPPVVTQLRVAFEFAFDRSRLARRVPTPTRCLAFSGTWRGTSGVRARRFCLSRQGVHAGGFLYPLGIEPWQLAYLNPR
jgi:hypothetical protein